MQPTQQFCFTHTNGQPVYIFTLRNKKGTEVTITNYGAIIRSFSIRDSNGKVNDIVLGFDNVEDYLSDTYLNNYCYFGCAIGRYANRIKNARFNIDGKEYELIPNKDNHLLHGGENGFDKKVWGFVALGVDPFPFLELAHTSIHSEEGFPGTLKTLIRFELSDNDELSYCFKAITDSPTIINLTHHSYFNLHNGIGDIKNHEVKIHSSVVLQQDEGLAANGELIQVKGTAHDFNDFKTIATGLQEVNEYDQSFVVKKDAKDGTLQLVAEVKSNKTNLLLQVYTTEPVVHFYTGKWIPEIIGKNGNRYFSFSGLCLETHCHPNAINNPSFPDTVLREGKIFNSKTVYKITHLEK